MEKTYTITIRDLSNEADFINSEIKRIDEKQEQIYKELQIKGKNILQVINSFIEHQTKELEKANLQLEVHSFYIDFYFSPLVNRLFISKNYCEFSKKLNTYLIDGEYDLLNNIELMTFLLKDWENFKKAFNNKIQLAYEKKKIILERKEKDIDELKNIFDNFKV